MFISEGQLIYSNNPYKLIVKTDTDLSRYYKSLIPKYLNVNKPMYDPHISVVRNEDIQHHNKWENYQFKYIKFQYEGYIFNDETYYWLNVESKQLENIRLELGLSNTKDGVTKSPDGKHNFHITIGNLKHLRNV